MTGSHFWTVQSIVTVVLSDGIVKLTVTETFSAAARLSRRCCLRGLQVQSIGRIRTLDRLSSMGHEGLW